MFVSTPVSIEEVSIEYLMPWFNISLNTLQVILETIFPANHLTAANTTNRLSSNGKPNLTASKLQNKKLLTYTKLNTTKLKPTCSVGAFYAILAGNRLGLEPA